MSRESEAASIELVWIARCAHRLRQQWPHAERVSLEEAAFDLWCNASLRALPPEQAAECWLTPLTGAKESEHRRSA